MEDKDLAKWLEGFSDKSIRDQEPELAEVISGLDGLSVNPIDESILFKKIEAKIAQTPRAKTIPLKSIIAIAASVLLLIGAVTFLGSNTTSISTAQNKLAQVDLPDNSTISVNSHSSISYKNDFNERTIELNGEAFFEVEKGTQFSVETPTGKVTVLGTSFNVFSRDQFLVVTCYSGSVKVERNNQSSVLTPGERVIVQEDEWISNKSVLNDNIPWSEAETTFSEMPLTVVLSSLTHQYGLELNKPSTDLTDLIFTGSYLNNDLDKALKMVLLPFDINYSIEEENILTLK